MAEAATLVLTGIEETLYNYALPREHWRRLRTNNPLERLLREVRRRARAVGAFPDGKPALIRSSLAGLTLTDRTLLFIDSSHVCRRGGDLPFFVLQDPAGVVIHVHDVFLPFDYPDNYVLLANHYLAREHRSALQAALGQRAGEQLLFCGASFWMMSR